MTLFRHNRTPKPPGRRAQPDKHTPETGDHFEIEDIAYFTRIALRRTPSGDLRLLYAYGWLAEGTPAYVLIPQPGGVFSGARYMQEIADLCKAQGKGDVGLRVWETETYAISESRW